MMSLYLDLIKKSICQLSKKWTVQCVLLYHTCSSFLPISDHLTTSSARVSVVQRQLLFVLVCLIANSPLKLYHCNINNLQKQTCFLLCLCFFFSPLCDMTQGCWAKWLWQIGIGNDKIGYLISMAEGIGLWCWVHSNKQTVWTPPGPGFDGSFHPSDGEILAMEVGALYACYLQSLCVLNCACSCVCMYVCA